MLARSLPLTRVGFAKMTCLECRRSPVLYENKCFNCYYSQKINTYFEEFKKTNAPWYTKTEMETHCLSLLRGLKWECEDATLEDFNKLQHAFPLRASCYK